MKDVEPVDIGGTKLQHQNLLVTLYGLYGEPANGSFPVSIIVEMFDALGIKSQAIRSTISRLKSRGVLINERAGNESQYQLSAEVMDSFRKDDQRIFAPSRSTSGDSLVLAIFSVPESERNRRYELRTELASLGFGMVSGGVAVGPHLAFEQAKVRLDARGLSKYVEFFKADYMSPADIRDKVAQWWDLEALDQQYTDFLQLYVGRLGTWQQRLADPVESAEQRSELERAAFAFYIPMLTRWRRFPYRDPNLPFEYLPDGWKAPQAKKTFLALHALLSPHAELYASRLLGSRVD
ncbi:phenylacetic acid degradation operon negative regulatory protein [Arthrobacter sp. JUb119]|nr:phenylacetic acid degradation operon negative regulatory protein [Arthrobacter sp. JUb119]